MTSHIEVGSSDGRKVGSKQDQIRDSGIKFLFRAVTVPMPGKRNFN